MKEHNIFLIGPMGVGKTTIGKQLSLCLSHSFKDSDKEIEDLTGVSIPLIFELEGEAGFRRREREMLDQLTQLDHLILATGGGVVLDPDNRAYLSQRGIVIYLYAAATHLLKRTSRTKNRPLLQIDNPQEKIKQLLRERVPLYESIADVKVETGRRTVKAVVKEILRYLETRRQQHIIRSAS